jgi:pyridoxine kinase
MNILSIQSEVVTGHVGNAAARFALQRLGHEAWCIPTVLLSSHAGHKGFAGEATSLALLTKLLDALKAQDRLAHCQGLISGYLGSPEQAEFVAEAVRRAKAANPSLLYCLDPAFGDDGRIYARPGVAEAMAEKLLPLADIVTPNAFELSVLAKLPIIDAPSAAAAVAVLARPLVVAKSVPIPGRLGAMVVINGTPFVASTPIVANPPRGAGDLFAALFFGHYLHGRLTAQALDLATRGVYHVLAASAGLPEMRLIAEQEALVAPPTPIGYRLDPVEAGEQVDG